MKRTQPVNFSKAVSAGILATLLMTVVMYGLPLFGLPAMDIMAALGGIFPWNISPYVMGAVIHFSLGILLALSYALLFYRWLLGPGWFRGALFSLAPWIFAITLLGPSLQVASEILKGKEAVAANPCAVVNPCAVTPANPCSLNQGVSNPCAVAANPCSVSANPCAVANPCGGRTPSTSGPSPQAMSLIAHLLYGVILGAAYKPLAIQA